MMLLACAILVLAWSIGGVTKDMNLSGFIIGVIGDNVPFAIIPVIIFLLGMLISFSTGTSWGTMTILTPIAIPLVYRMTGDANAAVMMSGVVFSGAIFGDHCSPISDTTVLASIFAGADHIDHVSTQIPYAILCALVTIVLYLFYGFFAVNPIILIFVGLSALILLTFSLNKFYTKRIAQ